MPTSLIGSTVSRRRLLEQCGVAADPRLQRVVWLMVMALERAAISVTRWIRLRPMGALLRILRVPSSVYNHMGRRSMRRHRCGWHLCASMGGLHPV